MASALTRAISSEIVALYARVYGHDRTTATTYINDNVVLCVLENILTEPEATLIDTGSRRGQWTIDFRMPGSCRRPCRQGASRTAAGRRPGVAARVAKSRMRAAIPAGSSSIGTWPTPWSVRTSADGSASQYARP